MSDDFLSFFWNEDLEFRQVLHVGGAAATNSRATAKATAPQPRPDDSRPRRRNNLLEPPSL